jgi:hypothetical protein
MSQIRKSIEELRVRSNLTVLDQKNSWIVSIPKGNEWICEITIPHDVLEWFACVKRREDQKEVWSDWMDYCGYDDSPLETLEAEMTGDIRGFVDRVVKSELRVPLQIYEART